MLGQMSEQGREGNKTDRRGGRGGAELMNPWEGEAMWASVGREMCLAPRSAGLNIGGKVTRAKTRKVSREFGLYLKLTGESLESFIQRADNMHQKMCDSSVIVREAAMRD